jgi:transcriptional regulator with XRE-family HTH domain
MRGIGKNLRKRAMELGISNAEAARRMGIDPGRYGHYVTDRCAPSFQMLRKIREVLGVSYDYLFTGRD